MNTTKLILGPPQLITTVILYRMQLPIHVQTSVAMFLNRYWNLDIYMLSYPTIHVDVITYPYHNPFGFQSDAKDVAKSTLPETRIQRLASDCSTDTCFTELDDDIPTNNITYRAATNSLQQVNYVNEIAYPCRESAIFQQKSDARDMWNSASTETDTQIDEDEMAKWQMDDVEPNSSVTWQLDDKPTDSVVYEIGTNSLKQIRDMISHMQAPLKQICDTLFQTQQRQLSQDDADECRHSWVMVAMVLDRLLFVTFLLLTIIVSTVLLLNHPMYAYEHVDRPLDSMD